MLILIGEISGIKNIYTYEIYTHSHKLKLLDMVVETMNGYCINFEFHKSATTEDLILRNIQYAINFRIETNKLIKSYIISMDTAKKSIQKAKISPDFEVEIPFLFFKNQDGDKILNNIKNKIVNNCKLNDVDFFNLTFIPFMKHEKSDSEITKELCYLVTDLDIPSGEKYKLKLCQILLVDIFIDDDEKDEMISVVKMSSKYLENYERRLVESGIEKEKQKWEQEKQIEQETLKNQLKKEKIRMVQELKKDNIPTNKIQKYTGLSLNMINMI